MSFETFQNSDSICRINKKSIQIQIPCKLIIQNNAQNNIICKEKSNYGIKFGPKIPQNWKVWSSGGLPRPLVCSLINHCIVDLASFILVNCTLNHLLCRASYTESALKINPFIFLFLIPCISRKHNSAQSIAVD